MTVRFGWLALLALAACQAEPSSCRLYRVNTLPVTLNGSSLLAGVSVNGQPVNLIVDTGAVGTFVTPQAASRVGLPITSTFDTGVNGVGGRRHFDHGLARHLDIGSLHVPNTPIEVADIGLPPAQPPIDGLLGIDLLNRFDLDIDLARRRLVFYEPGRACPGSSNALEPPLYSADLLPKQANDGRLHVTVTINGLDFRAVLDTGAAVTTLFKNAADRLALTSKPVSIGTLSGVGERRVPFSRQAIKSIGIGTLEVDNLPIAIADQPSAGTDDMLLGRDLLQRIHFWVSQSSRTLIMQAPPRASLDRE